MIAATQNMRIADLELPRMPFDDSDVVNFITEFSKCEGDAFMWLEDHGIGEAYQKQVIDAELLRSLSVAWVKSQLSVYALVGVRFWECMKELAQEAYETD